VIVVAHQTPGEDLPAVEITNVSYDLNKLNLFFRIVKGNARVAPMRDAEQTVRDRDDWINAPMA